MKPNDLQKSFISVAKVFKGLNNQISSIKNDINNKIVEQNIENENHLNSQLDLNDINKKDKDLNQNEK